MNSLDTMHEKPAQPLVKPGNAAKLAGSTRTLALECVGPRQAHR